MLTTNTCVQVKCVPWLPSEPTAKKALDLVPVHAAMSAPVVTLQEDMRIEDMRQILRSSRHNGFPVVRDTAAGQVNSTCFIMTDNSEWVEQHSPYASILCTAQPASACNILMHKTWKHSMRLHSDSRYFSLSYWDL